MKAYALASLKIGKKAYKASTDNEPVVVDLSQKEFNRLEAMGAVREPTANELKMADVEEAEIVEEKPATKTGTKGGKSAAPKSEAGTNTQAGGKPTDPDLSI